MGYKNEDRQWLHNVLQTEGYDVGSYDEFEKSLQIKEDADWYFDEARKLGLEIGDRSEFDALMGLSNAKKSEGTPLYAMSEESSGGALPTLEEQAKPNSKLKFGKPGFIQDEATALHPMSDTSVAERLSNPRILDENNNIRAVQEAEEEENIDKMFVSKPMKTPKDVYDNYSARFTNTQRGIELNAELAKVQDELTKKYLKEFENSAEYKQYVGKKYRTQAEADEANKALNELFLTKYGDAINEDMKPYQKAYNEELNLRYGSQMENELNRINKDDANSRLGELSSSVDSELENIEEKIEARTKAVRNVNWKPGVPSSRDDNTLKELRGQRTYLNGAKELIEESQKIIQAAKDAKDGTVVGGVLRGVRDKAFDIDTWTMGLSDLVGGMRLNNILEKVEKGEKLTQAEEMLFDASVNNMAINYYYQNDLGKGYMAGQITGESLPFMLEMIINPISASGNVIAKRLLNAGLKKFAKNKAAQVGARLVGDATAAIGMSSTTGLPSIIGDTYRRLNEGYDYGVDEGGNLYANKKADAVGMGEAFARSFTTRAIENQSEMIFNAFKGVGGFMKGVQDVIPGGVNGFFNMLSLDKVADAYRWLKNSPVFRNYLVKDVRNATQIGGIFEEYAEEVYNNLANFAIGEMSWEDVVSLDKNIDTFLGLAPTQVMFGILGLGGAASMRYQTRKTLEDLKATMNEQQRKELEGLLDMGIDAKEVDVRGFIRGVMENQKYTIENKRDLIKAAYYVAQQRSIDELTEADVIDKVNAENQFIDSMTDPSTGNYAELSRNVINPQTGESEQQKGYVVGWIGEGEKRQPIFVADGMDNNYANRVVLKPTEWSMDSYREMPAEQVKAVNEEMNREEAAAQAERESKYATKVLNYVPMNGDQVIGADGQVLTITGVTPDGIVYENGEGKVEQMPLDNWKDLMQAQLEAQEATATPTSPMESQASTPTSPMSTPMSEEVQPVAEGSATEQQVAQPQAPIIPTKEDGSIDFVSYGKEGTFKTLGEKYGEKMPNKVAITAKALAEDVKKAQKKLNKAEEAYDNAPIGREQKAEEVRDKAKAELEAIQREANFWAEMDAEIKEAQAVRESMLNPQAEVNTSSEPLTSDEFVAQQLASGNIVFNKEDYKRETGYGDEEVKAMNGGSKKLLTGDGMTIQEAGERLMEMDRENGTNFFDQSDPNAGRDELLYVLGSVKTRKELNQYVASNRAEQAKRDSEGLYNERERQVMDAHYASLEDYVLQMEASEMENPFRDIDVAQIDVIFAEVEEEYQNYINNEQGTTSEIAEGSDNVLSEEQADNTGGTSGVESEGDSGRNGERTSEESERAYAATEELKQEEGETTLQFAERAAEENDRREPLRNRAREWAVKLGVTVNLIESVHDVYNLDALAAIQSGQRVTGWFEESTGEVCFYMPFLESESDVDATFIHEVVAHKGLRGLLGEKFDAFCDEVWDVMSNADRLKFMAYPGVSHLEGKKKSRAAADEYIAHLAENVDVTESAWSKLTELVKRFLKALGLEPKMTNADIANTIKKSYQRLLEGEESVESVGNGTRFNAKKKSDRRQDINRINNTVDQALSLVTGLDIKDVKAERVKKAQKRKEDAAEIYQSVLSGDFNDVTLQEINDYIDDATPLHPYGRRISQRLPQKLERSLHEGSRTNAVDALFSRIHEKAVPASRRTSEAGRREIEERKKEALKGWAIATNNWHTDLSEFTDEQIPIGEGTDSKVYASKDGKYVIKTSFGKPEGKRFRPDIDNIPLFNSVFRNSAYEIVGYGEFDGKFARILKQPFVEFAEDSKVSVDERVDYMRTLGFEPINESKTAFSNGTIIVADLQKSNIVKTAQGNIRVIDADVKLHTKDVGGNYTYPPVEADLPNSTSFRISNEEKSIIDKAKADGTYMLAPNGEPTNLTEKQWVQVRTKAFKKWFGDWEKNPKKSSLMIDENGEPKVYYHGSPSRFNEFISDKMGETGAGYGQGFYFSPEKWFAEGYVGENGGTLYEVFLNLRKPISDTKKTLKKPSIKRFIDEIDKRMMKRDDDGIGILDNWDDVSYYRRNKVLNEATEAVFEYNETDLEIVGDLINTSGSYDVVTEVLRDILGFDGVLPSNTDNEVIVHHPNQIKSATDNVGTFDEGNNDIRFRFIGERGARNLDKAEEATTRLDNLAIAREMESAEKDAKTIKMATGWERGADGLWRYEVDDNIDFELRRPKKVELKKAYDEANEKYYKLEMRVPVRTPKNATEEERQRIKDMRKELAKLRKAMNKAFDAYYDYSAESATLGEFLGKDNQLFKEYPELAGYDVSFLRDSKKLAEGLKGSFTPEYKVIWVDDARPKGDIKSTLVHEIQHAIQGIEGFAQGGTPAAFASAKYQAEEWKANFNKFINRYGFEDWSKNLPTEDWMKYGKEYKGQFGGLHRAFIDNAVEDEDVKKTLTKELDYVKSAYDKFYQIAGGMDPAYKFKDANEWYRSLSGEVESRNVQQRMGMTDEQRRSTLASETEDVAREDQIFLQNAMEEGQTMFRVVKDPAVDYISQAEDVVEVPRDEVMYTMNNIANQLYKVSGRFMRELYKYGTIGRVLKGEYAEIDQIKAKREYDHAKPIFDEYLNELVWMKYQSTEAAQEVINDVISDVEYAMQYYKDLALGKDVWRTKNVPRFRISEKHRKDVSKAIADFTSSYNSKPVSYITNDMTDEQVDDLLEGYLDSEDVQRMKNEGANGFYLRKNDRIYIFVDDIPLEAVENSMFHENLHLLLGANNPLTSVLWDKVKDKPNKFIEVLKNSYRSDEWAEEYFVYHMAKGLSEGELEKFISNFAEADKEALFNILNTLGYEYESESRERLGQRRRIRATSNSLQQGGKSGERRSGESREALARKAEERKERLQQLFGRVADMGLDGVLGNKEYVNAMVDMYKVLPEAVQREVADEALSRYGGDVAPAVSDWLNHKAEASVWDKVVAVIREALRKVGFDLDLNTNEAKYILWRSQKPLNRNNLLEVAEDIDMKNRLKVGEYSANDDGTTPDGGGTKFRVSGKLNVRDEYEATIKKGGFQAREAVQDAMLSLRKFQELIEKVSGKKIRDFENAWMHENRLSSVVQAQIHEMERKFYKPMMDAVKKLMAVASLEQEQVADYLMLKHGIERNREMAVRKALTDSEGRIDRTRLEQWYQDKRNVRSRAATPHLDTWRKQQEELDNIALMYGADMSRDYSGLTSMFGTDDLADSTQQAYDEVEALETAHPAETEALGKAIKAMTQNTLDESFGSGLMDRKVYDELSKDMYDYYIPLRGFDETTSEEVYAYLDQDRGAFNAPLKRAKGRSSKSDNPIAYLKSIAESGIMQGERNKMKQSFLNLVINNPSDLVSVREGVWAFYNPASGEWEAAAPPAIPNNATPADVEAAMEAWEANMESLAASDPNVKKVSEAQDIPYRVVGNRMNQHQVTVKRLGKSYTLTINGNPRLAMALNGLTNPNNKSNDGKVAAYVSGKIDSLNRTLSAWYTTRNPDFVASNFMRDTFYTNTIVRAKEGNAYANKFHKNYGKVLPQMLILFSKYENGTLNPADKTEAAFLDFMLNGGETGYSNLKDLEHIKKQIAKELKGNRFAKVEALAEKLDILNRAVENTARFAAFLTSREEGRSIAKSVFDAKEISVNFNKKGAGGTFFGMIGQTWFGNLAAMVGVGGRALYVFFNAAVQGTTNLMHVMKVNPKGTSAGLAAMFLMGAVVPFLFGGDDDDEKDYYDLPEHVRRNHLIIPGTGDAWISIPLPIEYRIMYGMGELLSSWRTGHERGSDIARKMLNLTGQALPLNFLEEGLDAFVPSAISPIWQVYNNRSWTGLPIYKDNEFNKDDPEYTKAFKNTDRGLVKFTKALYEWTFDEENQEDGINLNPAVIETLAKGYFGGLATQLSNIMKVGGMIAGEQEFDWRNIPIGNRILKTGDERTKGKRVTNEYFENMEKLDFLQSRERMLKKVINGPSVPQTDKDKAKIDDEIMRGSDVYKKYQEFKTKKKEVDKIRKTIKGKGSTPELEKKLMDAQEAANKAVR